VLLGLVAGTISTFGLHGPDRHREPVRRGLLRPHRHPRLHVLAAALVLLALVGAGRADPAARPRLEAAGLYWYFVCAVWGVIFPVVYLQRRAPGPGPRAAEAGRAAIAPVERRGLHAKRGRR
jgi:hypothetical protein